MRTRRLATALLPLLACRAYGDVFVADATADRARLAALATALLPAREGSPAVVDDVFRWLPVDGVALVIYSACRGHGDARACVVNVVGPRSDGSFTPVLGEPCGWSPARLGETAERGVVAMQGEDGRGVWRQWAVYEPGTAVGSVHFTRRRYDDGL